MDYYGYNGYNFGDYDAFAGFLGSFVIVIIVLGLIGLTISIIQIIGLWKVFKKAGKGGWEALIPIYSNYVLLEISGLNWWWFLIFLSPLILSFIPGIALLASLASSFTLFNCYYNLSKKFNKGIGFAICLTLFTPICILILGLSKDNVYSNITVSNNGVFGPSDNTNNNTTNYNYQNYNNEQPMYNTMNSVQQDNTNNQNDMNQFANTATKQFSFCGNCGTKLDSNARFCPNCGKERV